MGSLKSLMIFSINTNHAFTSAREKIHLPITALFLHSYIGNIFLSKNIHNWVPLNAILLLQFSAEGVILDGQ